MCRRCGSPQNADHADCRLQTADRADHATMAQKAHSSVVIVDSSVVIFDSLVVNFDSSVVIFDSSVVKYETVQL